MQGGGGGSEEGGDNTDEEGFGNLGLPLPQSREASTPDQVTVPAFSFLVLRDDDHDDDILVLGVVVDDDDDEKDVFALDPVPIIFLVIDDMTMIRINSATKL